MLQLLVAGLLGSATAASGATVDLVRSPQGPFTRDPNGTIVGLALPTATATVPDGRIYVVGNVRTPGLPITEGVFVDGPRSVGGLFFPISITCVDAFIARISAASILYATCLGGMGEDSADDAASDAGRHADVTGVATFAVPGARISFPLTSPSKGLMLNCVDQ
jgi:hypothetical protein